MKTGLVMEGGAMRGMFTAGILDVWLDENISFDGAIGISAGAIFGCNMKSKQRGRSIRYNVKYCKDPRYASFRSWIKTGDIYGTEFCYTRLPKELDIFDTETYKNNPMEFYVGTTDVYTGKPVYHRCDDGLENDLKWFRASASMPMVSNIVEVDGNKLLDGGVSDSIPLKYFQGIGYEKNIVILTQPKGYVKTKNSMVPLMKVALRKYPKLIEAMANRHIMYNETTAYIEEQEKLGNTLVIRPDESLKVGHIEHNPEKLMKVYNQGIAKGKETLEAVKTFLEK